MGRCWILLEGNITRPTETFCSTSPESFWQPASCCLPRTQRRGHKTWRGDWHYSPGALCVREDTHTDWLTDWPLCISKCPHLFVPWSLGKMLLFWAGPFHECLPMIYVITAQTEDGIRILFCRHFDLPFIFYQHESTRYQAVWSIERDVLI